MNKLTVYVDRKFLTEAKGATLVVKVLLACRTLKANSEHESVPQHLMIFFLLDKVGLCLSVENLLYCIISATCLFIFRCKLLNHFYKHGTGFYDYKIN